MFTVIENPEFTETVPVAVPGEAETQRITARFRVVDTDDLDWNDQAAVKAFLDEAVINFEGLGDDQKRPIACTPEIRAQLLRRPYIRVALIRSYVLAVTKAASGN
ncbi:hypothetical protein D2T29_19620 [Sinirhodobacter populi]|uniref:Uncharacterized protein n=1 Tax=Paenirhodobacter populi TaxID=2306993 RepID=A0A443K1Z8_9RHOB|nr:hypothetical protein [Sinirhodobacter populi]RWR26788.1 hypothetical protein D2T29_19620 [Sinirhodobacter populi]